MNYGLLLFATVFAGSLCVGEAIKCYSCMYSTTFSSKSIAGCNDGKDFSASGSNNGTQINILECSGKCMKVKGKAGSIVTIDRTCSGSCVEALVAGIGIACCTTDLCNAAWRMAQSTPAFVLAAGISMLLAGLNRG